MIVYRNILSSRLGQIPNFYRKFVLKASLIWCISITNNEKSSKKVNETAQTANFTDFPLISCGNSPSWTKTMQTLTPFSLLQNFSEIFSWRPAVFENVMVFYAIIFLTRVITAQSWVKSQDFFWQSGGVTKINTRSILSFILPYSIRVEPIGMFLGWLNGRTWKGKL